jgi:4-amino-4-deoxy-L-arabinose transferase-like glycosyltransferase
VKDRSSYLADAAVGLTALLPRLYVAIAWPREPVWDGHYYDFGARRIAAGLGYSDGVTVWHPWCHWPVGYSGFLAGAYAVFGSGPHVATIANAVVGTVLAVLVRRLASFAFGPGRALVAGMLVALYPGLIAYTALVMTEPLSATLLVLAGLFACGMMQRRPVLGAALAGLSLGAGTLVHPTFVAFAPAIGLLAPRPEKRSGARSHAVRMLEIGALATACAVLPVVPWTLRNCRVMDRCTFVSTNGGWNLAIGAFPRATGRFETLRSTDGCRVVTGQVQQDACWRDLGLRWIAADPARWLGLVPKKLGFTFNHEAFPIEYLHEADPDRWPEPKRAAGRGLLTAAHRILLTLAAFGVVLKQARTKRELVVRLAMTGAVVLASIFAWASDASPFYLSAVLVALLGVLVPPWRKGQGALFWAAFTVLGTLAARAVFFGEDRYHIVVTPLLCILAAGVFRRDTDDSLEPRPRQDAR